MLRMLQSEIAHNFQYTDIRLVVGWLRFVPAKGAHSLTEVDCKKQFDNINPHSVTRAFRRATRWLYKKRRWRQQDLQWSIHCDTPQLDRAGVAASEKFWVLWHKCLERMLKLEFVDNNVLQAVGELWSRSPHPWGRASSAHTVDLHTLWGIKTGVSCCGTRDPL